MAEEEACACSSRNRWLKPWSLEPGEELTAFNICLRTKRGYCQKNLEVTVRKSELLQSKGGMICIK